MTLSNLPPGCTSLPGDFDQTVSFSITFPYTTELDTDDIIEEIMTYTGINDLSFDMDTLTHNHDGSYTIYITYSDDIEMNTRRMVYLDIECVIIEHTNKTIRDANIDENDDTVDIEFEVH